jgi:small-conductance mechanosensitive channel
VVTNNQIAIIVPNSMFISEPVINCFREFGESSLNFTLRVWNQNHAHRKLVLYSALNFAIYDKFKERGIEIPLPQREMRIRSGSIQSSGLPPST